ncbi:MAG TPA: ADP-ribosylglycohydrolase family protein [Propionibacteriaceae bacterium]|nr:ADP-ribosylglycohydrolase family protein [Propionibacteriaceae bacterium]
MRLTWVQPEDLLLHELSQSRAEGVDVTDVEQRWLAAAPGSLEPPVGGTGERRATPEQRRLAEQLLDELDVRVAPPDPRHPESLLDIEAAWAVTAPSPPGQDLLERLTGAWLGRAAGCLLGKPVEKLPRAGIYALASATGNWPLCSYFTAVGLDAATAAAWPWNRRSATTSLAENIDGMPEDDDLNYPMLNLGLLEAHGAALDTEQIAIAWLADLPAARTFTAERAAYRNLLQAMPLAEVARRRNPYREWIGALIRGDVFGWVYPGDPSAAARLAWRDARLSHTRNGAYGELWVAALTSSSLVGADVDEVLATAAQIVPPRSQLAEAIAFGTELGRRERGLDSKLDALHERYGHLHWVHTLNNAAAIACALSGSGGDFTAGIGLAVMAGWDTDSSAATVGAVLGALLGRDGLPASWVDPLDNRIDTSLPGGPVHIDELAARTARVAGSLRR